jgi:hypothetical protein
MTRERERERERERDLIKRKYFFGRDSFEKEASKDRESQKMVKSFIFLLLALSLLINLGLTDARAVGQEGAEFASIEELRKFIYIALVQLYCIKSIILRKFNHIVLVQLYCVCSNIMR